MAEEQEDQEEEELTRRSLKINLNLSIEANEKCLGLEKLAEAQVVKVITLVGGLPLPCLQLAEKKITVSCFLMD